MSDYSIWILEYSYLSQYFTSGLIYGAHNEGNRKLPYCYVLIKGKGRAAMVDVGFNNNEYGAKVMKDWGITKWHSARDVLAEVDLTPEQITDIFITHAHFDHMGGTDDFPKATFYIQERELSKWVWAMSMGPKFNWLMGATDPGDMLRAVALAKNGRLQLVEGDRENVLPGIDLHAAYDSHTWGSMFVTVRNDGKSESSDSWILAGDLVYCFENLQGRNGNEGYIPIGYAVGSQTNLLLTTDRMLGMVGHETRRVIPVHEERLKDTFPTRTTKNGLLLTEICLADGEPSRVQ